MLGEPFSYKHRVGFGETDAAGVAHFTQYMLWAERAEHFLMAACEVPVLPEGGGGWPRVKVEADYLASARFGDTVVVMVEVEDIGRASIQWAFQLKCGERDLAKIRWTTVRVDPEGKSCPLSETEREALLYCE